MSQLLASPGQTLSVQHTLWLANQAVVNAGSTVAWTMINDQGWVLASGSASIAGHSVVAGKLKLVIAADIGVPSQVPATPAGVPYSVVYDIQLFNGVDHIAVPYQETITVQQASQAKLGAQTSIELWGGVSNLRLITSEQVLSLGYAVYLGNQQVATQPSITPMPVASPDGYEYAEQFDSSTLGGASLDPFLVMWNYTTVISGPVYNDMGKMWVINPRIYMAAQNLQQIIQRAVINIDGVSDQVFKPEDLMSWLVQGRAHFNAFAHPTSFTMNNASDTVMYFWVTFAAINALRSQFLVESLKAFDYGGQQVSLSVDHAAAFDSLASTLEQQVGENCRQFKQLLSKRGLTAGDGNVNGTETRQGAMGNVGISLSPVSSLRNFNNGNSWLGVNKIF